MANHVSLSAARAPRERDETAQLESAPHESAQNDPAPQEVDSRIPKTVLVQRRFAGRNPLRELSLRQPVNREPASPEPAKREPAKRKLDPSDLSRIDLARLEALLANELQRSPSPSIASDDTHEMPPAVRAPARRPVQPAQPAQASWRRGTNAGF